MSKINAIGDACPIPVIKAKKALKELTGSESLLISVDNEIATENLGKLAKELGYDSQVEKLGDDHYDVTITKNEDAPVSENERTMKSLDCFNVNENTVIAIGSQTMGEGAEELGKTLMKGFIYAITELDELPKTILFYNGGAKIPIKGSTSVEDLEKLEKKGVEILTCGACLNYYEIADELAIGGVTNMYTILEKLSNAVKIIKP